MNEEKLSQQEKLAYETPTLTVHGDVETITLGAQIGEILDAAFTIGASTAGKGKKPKTKSPFS